MNYNIKSYLLLTGFITLICLISCQYNKENKHNISDDLNKLSTDYYALRFEDSLYVEKAINKAHEAIKYDSLNISPYNNLAIYYDWNNNFDKAIETLNLAISRICSPEVASVHIQKGLMFIKNGVINDEVKKSFELARILYKEQLSEYDDVNKEYVLSEIAFTFLFTHSKERAITEINYVIEAFPNSTTANGYKEMILSYDIDS